MNIRPTDTWLEQVTRVTILLGALLLGAVLAGRLFLMPWSPETAKGISAAPLAAVSDARIPTAGVESQASRIDLAAPNVSAALPSRSAGEPLPVRDSGRGGTPSVTAAEIDQPPPQRATVRAEMTDNPGLETSETRSTAGARSPTWSSLLPE